MSLTDVVPIDEGLFEVDGDETRLIGSRCGRCEAHYFPSKQTCMNPRCEAALTEQVTLGPTGRIFSYTIQYYDLPAPYDLTPAPYAIGLVELHQPIRVAGLLTVDDPASVRIGQPVRATTKTIGTDGEGRSVLTWAFEIVDEESANE